MKRTQTMANLRAGKAVISFIIGAFMVASSSLGVVGPNVGKAEADSETDFISNLATIQGNSLLGVSVPTWPFRPVKKVTMIATAYSSTLWQTDADPFITASGSVVRDGIVASNLLPFGTKIKIPELYGNKVFVVEDRMNRRKGDYQLDIWFQEYSQAKNFGAKKVSVEIYEN